MKKRTFTLFVIASIVCLSQAQETFTIEVENPLKIDRYDEPVVLPLSRGIRSAFVEKNGKEIPCQLDDLNRDGQYDELCFLTDISARSKQQVTVKLFTEGTPRTYTPRTYASLILRNSKVKEKNKHDIYLRELTLENGSDIYPTIHQHGVVMETELTAFRIYFDHRQTIDLYGKYHKQLELEKTQFYPDAQQLAEGYGDDVLWVGNTFGGGCLRGWNGTEPTMLRDVDHRTQRIVAQGPLRTIVEVVDEGWAVNSDEPKAGTERLTMTSRYTMYAGHRDCKVNVSFDDRLKPEQLFSTGIINVKNSTELNDGKGLRGCWGKDWTVAEKDSAGHVRETVGLGVYVPEQFRESEIASTKENYGFVVKPTDGNIIFHLAFASDKEDFGFHSANEWFNFLKTWKREIESPLKVVRK